MNHCRQVNQMNENKSKTAYVALTFNGQSCWSERVAALATLERLEKLLEEMGFQVLRFDSLNLPFDPWTSEDTITNFIKTVDLVACVEGGVFMGFGEISLKALATRDQTELIRLIYRPATNGFVPS